ncbi:hypothetical protein [Pontibacillus halophilus]|uniref:hypothetical protein n=1 Tax=Pontibacillus halophilus TaxID=516704 RepID=UPI000429783C|nr:hypothetical protein [Pontibacillus halophilus]
MSNALINIINADMSREVQHALRAVYEEVKVVSVTDFSDLDLTLQSSEYSLVALDQESLVNDIKLLELVEEFTSIEHLIYFSDENTETHEKIKVFNSANQHFKEWLTGSSQENDVNEDLELPLDFNVDLPYVPPGDNEAPPEGEDEITETHEQPLPYESPEREKEATKEGSQLQTQPETPNSEVGKDDIEDKEGRGNKEDKQNEERERFLERAKQLKHYLEIPFYKTKLTEPKSIGVWSPARNGVSTFIQNFAMFLARYHIPIAVLEGITRKARLEETMSRYKTNGLERWNPFSNFLIDHSIPPESVNLEYQRVRWFPFGLKDHISKWDSTQIEFYMNTLKLHDLLFVDLESGDMNEYTLHSLNHIDELWIVGSDCVYDTLEFKDFIHKVLIQEKNINCKLLFNQYGSNSTPEVLADSLNLPLIGKGMHYLSHEEVLHNNIGDKPLLYHKKALNQFHDSFYNLAIEVLGEETWTTIIDNNKIKHKILNGLLPMRRSKHFHMKMIESVQREN